MNIYIYIYIHIYVCVCVCVCLCVSGLPQDTLIYSYTQQVAGHKRPLSPSGLSLHTSLSRRARVELALPPSFAGARSAVAVAAHVVVA